MRQPVVYKPKTLAALAEPLGADESFLVLCDWREVVDDTDDRISRKLTLGLTGRGLWSFHIGWAVGFFTLRPIVASAEFIAYSHINDVDVTQYIDRRGIVQGIHMRVDSTSVDHDLDLESALLDADRFVEHLRVRVAREQQGAQVAEDLPDMVERWAALRGAGLITDEEFARAKTMLLGRPADKVQQAEAALRSLHSLLQAGVLSEGEFRMKKWDLLSR